ncbi:MAG: GTPase ObgE [Microgenomates group bacterium GW2011_GWF2_45_18]|nr:MAG: GTPase ObgE [Microgenomates group bacterium GW2011_GWF1_44_10]KKU01628.1 MAG: GTPase ObgE [Microgenomates group bacterium GW2011_GWF2_45_18]
MQMKAKRTTASLSSSAFSTSQTIEKIWKGLREVIDPELHIDIVSLGLIYDVRFDNSTQHYHIEMTLTTPGCPLAGVFDGMIRDAVAIHVEPSVMTTLQIELTFDPPWVSDMMSDDAKHVLGFK